LFMEPTFLDIARLFVQQLRKGLDLPKFHRYIANHMTIRRSQQNKISLQHDGEQDPTSARRRTRSDFSTSASEIAERIGFVSGHRFSDAASMLSIAPLGAWLMFFKFHRRHRPLGTTTTRSNTMNYLRLLAIGTILTFALTTSAQQSTTTSNAHAGSVPTVEGHLKVLSEKLDLTADQQAKTKPILQEMHEATQKLMQDESMSHEERMSKVRAAREKADKKIREILNDDQKKKLDQLEQGPHPDLHGDKNEATSPPQAPQN
jgi:hypothetical protein